MLIKKSTDIASSEITPRPTYLRRRDFLAALVTLPTVSRLVTTTDALTPKAAITSYTNFYEFGSDKGDASRNGGAFKASPWSVTVDGLCGKPGTYALDDMLKPHPLEERVYRMRCVEGWSMVIPWVGFPLNVLIKEAEPLGKASFVAFETILAPDQMPNQKHQILQWPYVEGLRMDEAMHPLTILVVALYDQILPNVDGAPLRLAVPWKYGFKGIKSIVKVTFTDFMPPTTWNQMAPNEYGFYSNVNPHVDHPRWSQATERKIGASIFSPKQPTLMFNGYGDQVASLYTGMDLRKYY